MWSLMWAAKQSTRTSVLSCKLRFDCVLHCSVSILFWKSREADVYECINLDQVKVHGNVYRCCSDWQRYITFNLL